MMVIILFAQQRSEVGWIERGECAQLVNFHG